MKPSAVLTLLTTLALAYAAPTSQDVDAFYAPPADLASQPPGTILRHRPIIASFFGFIPDPIEAHQILYRTTAINGTAIATTTTVFKPIGAKKDRFVQFSTAYDSAATKCNPSISYQLGGSQEDGISTAEFFILQGYLLAGNIVASADYEGPDAAFTAGRLSGMAVLDSIRAVQNFATLGLEPNPMVVGVGYSGGAIATGWAASLQKSYAPEVDVKGWIAGGTPANLTAVVTYIDNTAWSGFLPIAVAGLTKPSAYGDAEIQQLLKEKVTDEGKAALAFASSNCAPANIAKYPFLSILSTKFQTIGAGFFSYPPIAKILERSIMGVDKNETPAPPVLLYHATQDEIIPYDKANALASSWCSSGGRVKFVEYAAGGHITTEVLGFPDAIKFTLDVFSGKGPTQCSQQTTLNNKLDPLALGANFEPLLNKLIEILAKSGGK